MDQAYLIARAYAVLGLAPGCSQRDAARQYKQLAKRWHPDHFANDPQGQAEAAQRMREINHAYALIRNMGGRRVADRGTGQAEASPPRQPIPTASPEFHARLTREEIDAIAAAIGTPSFFDMLLRAALIGGCLVGGLLMILYGTTCTSVAGFRSCSHAAGRTGLAIALLSVPAVVFIRAIWADPGAARRAFSRALRQRMR